MNKKLKTNLIIITVIIATWLLAIADLIVPIKTMYGEGFYNPIVNATPGKVLYITCALFTFPIIAYGLKQIFKGTNVKWVTPFIYFFTGTITVSIHTSFYFYYYVAKRIPDNPEMIEIIKDFDKLKDVLGTAYFVGLGILSALLFIVVLSNKTIYPRYFAIFNPITGVILLKTISLISLDVARILNPILIPGTMQAIMITIYLPYYFKNKIEKNPIN